MNTQPTTWSAVRDRAATPGSVILNEWRATREAERTQALKPVENATTVSTANSSAEILDFFGIRPGAAGMHVTPESAMRVSAVAACVQRITGAVTSMPVNIYERTSEGRKQVEGDPKWWLLNEQPTAAWNAASMWEQILGDMLLKESGFAFLRRSNSGDIREIVPLPWSAVRVERYQGSGRLKYFVNDITTFGADQDDILHFPGFGFDGMRAKSVIAYAARNAAGNAMAMDEYSGKFFANGAHPSIVLSTEKGMKDPQIATLQQMFMAKYSGIDNAHRLPLVLTEGLKVDNLSLTSEDAQLLESRKYQVVDIARAFGVPPHLIGETSASTSWGTGLEEMSRAFIMLTVNQHLKRLEQELNRKIYPRSTRFYAEFFRDALMEGNSKAQSDYYRAAIGGPGSGPGWMTVDEVRKTKHLPPMGGDAAKLFYSPANTKAPVIQEQETKT